MRKLRPLELTYLVLAVLGAVIPLATFLPWLAQHGLDPSRFVAELFANRISAFFAWDVMISAIVVIVATVARRDALPGSRKAGVILGTLLVGVSLGLPLLLFFSERARTGPR